MDGLVSENVLTGFVLYAVLTALAVWVTLILWSWQDMAGRSRSTTMRFLAALLVALLNLPGLFIYLMLRPRATLADAYERSLEEEVLLQGIEERLVCPSCKARVRQDWQLCPSCNARLRKPCTRCGNLLEPEWERCPWCASRQSLTEEGEWPVAPRRIRPGTATRQAEVRAGPEGQDPQD